MDIYLLDVGELMQGGSQVYLEPMLYRLDPGRREKVMSAKTARGRAAELGAGLLLQKAVQDWKKVRPADTLEEGMEYVYGAAPSCQYPRTRLCTVSGLLSEPEAPVPLTYRYGDKGKPYFENIPLFFNISHSGEYVLCAVSSREVGADIQKIQQTDVMKLAKRFFSEPEYRILERCESDGERRRLFFGLWSRKEAYGKLTGEGIAAVLGKDVQNADAKRDVEWLDVSPPEGYAMAVCRLT